MKTKSFSESLSEIIAKGKDQGLTSDKHALAIMYWLEYHVGFNLLGDGWISEHDAEAYEALTRSDAANQDYAQIALEVEGLPRMLLEE